VVVDNASTDNTCNALAEFRGRIRLIRNQRNLGFAAAQNQAIRQSSAPWVLALNPDVLLAQGFLQELLEAAKLDPQAGTLCGKLLSIGPGFRPLPEPTIDSTGIYFTPAMRHFDRGYHEPDEGRYETAEYVFGATAAAALYRREMIEDISLAGDFFDPDFFTYREDADVAWRAQLLGWRCIYAPAAVAHHVRTVSPQNRKSIPPVLNMHSVKNRFLLRVNNLTPGIWRRYWLPMLWRDLVVIGGCLLAEPASLPAFWNFARCLSRSRQRRRLIMSRRTVSDDVLAEWFSLRPVAYPIGAALPIATRELRAAASSASVVAP
jgi:GT2 family glycosyltransferase